jgi:2-amino-4-hydroxy-6-hydroxymethyldihydropteridine diphosphokinase
VAYPRDDSLLGQQKMPVVYLGFGSNMGNRGQQLNRAIELMKQSGIDVRKVSSYIETDPVGGPPQGKFLNAVVMAETKATPVELLKLVQSVETTMGRVRTVANAPRPIDIDILLYDHLILQSQDLTIPHPRMHQRAFVLNPLKEIAPQRFEEFFNAHH